MAKIYAVKERLLLGSTWTVCAEFYDRIVFLTYDKEKAEAYCKKWDDPRNLGNADPDHLHFTVAEYVVTDVDLDKDPWEDWIFAIPIKEEDKK